MLNYFVNFVLGVAKTCKFCFFPRKTLVVGPYTGELGWEMMVWQGFVRAIRKHYKKVIVISYPSSRPFYEDCTFIPHNSDLTKSGFGMWSITRKQALNLVIKHIGNSTCDAHYDLLLPHDLNRVSRLIIGAPIFLRLAAEKQSGNCYDILFHFRDFEREGDVSSKSYPHEEATQLYEMCKSYGFSCACIGHPELSYCPSDCCDLRALNMQVAIDSINNSRLVCGGSSAPMHLASLCAKPIVVWIGHGATLDRYFSYWNPHGSPVFAVTDKTFQPSPKNIFEQIKKALT